MELERVVTLFLIAFATQITPGPNNIILATSGARVGLVGSLGRVAGVVCGYPGLVFVVGLTLGEIVLIFDDFVFWLNLVTVIILSWLVWAIATAEVGKPHSEEQGDIVRFGFWGLLLFQLVNPKAWSIAIAINSYYLRSDHDILPQVVTVGLMCLLVSIVSSFTWVSVGVFVRRFFDRGLGLRIFNWVMAGLLALTIPFIIFS